MHARLQCHFPVWMHRLLPAFAWVVTQTSGTTVIRRRGFERLLVPGQQLTLEPLEPVDVLLDGNHMQPAACTIEVLCDALEDLREATLYQGIAQRVFLQPQLMWDASHVSERLNMPALKVRSKLFSQGYALTDICRTQRLMRVLFEVAQGGHAVDALKRRVGWPMHGDLDTAFHDRLGVSLTTARHLGANQATRVVELPTVFRLPHQHEQRLATCE